MLTAVKLAIPIKTNAYDPDLLDLIAAARADLNSVGVKLPDEDPLMRRAIVTYAKMKFGTPPDYDRLKMSYDEQKAQLMSAHSYRAEAVTDE